MIFTFHVMHWNTNLPKVEANWVDDCGLHDFFSREHTPGDSYGGVAVSICVICDSLKTRTKIQRASLSTKESNKQLFF